MGEAGKLDVREAEQAVTIKVSPEFKELCDQFEKKINAALWNVGVRIGYPKVTKIMARKIKRMILS